MKAAKDHIRMVMPDLELDTKVKNLTQEQIMRLVLCKWILCKPGLLLLLFKDVTGHSAAFALPVFFLQRK